MQLPRAVVLSVHPKDNNDWSSQILSRLIFRTTGIPRFIEVNYSFEFIVQRNAA